MSTTESFRAFADCLREPAILVSTTGEVLSLNSAAASLFGLDPKAGSVPFRLADVLQTGGTALDDFIRACARTRRPIFAALTIPNASGEPGPFRAEGLLYQPATSEQGATVFIRLLTRAAAHASLLPLADRLRSAADDDSTAPRLANINEIVSNALTLLRPLLGERIELSTRLISHAPIVHLDPAQLARVLVNVGMSIRDRMPDGGKMTVETAAAEGFAVITIRDDGLPLAGDALQKLFEPWPEEGDDSAPAAISLASSQATLTALGGNIQAQSDGVRGVTFTVQIPVASPIQAHTQTRPPVAVTVLVVDDDDTARDLIADSLISAEFNVLSASDGVAAVELVNEYSGTIDLLVTDVVMPRLTGPRLAAILRERLPKLRVLYVSGYTDGVDLPIDRNGKRAAFLAKPFTRGTLLGRVNVLLGS